MSVRTGGVIGGCRFLPAEGGLQGALAVPGDKSVSHRAVLLGAVNDGPVRVEGFLRSADTLATVAAVRALGVTVEDEGEGLCIEGRGWEGLQEPEDVVDVGNAGTLIRLLPGLIAPTGLFCVLTGDASIRRRPMARVLEPLAAMGALVAGRSGDTLPPIAVRGGALVGVTHRLSVASAQVKSCLLLAGLRARGETAVVEPGGSRDHTERMIVFAGGRVEREGPADRAGVVRVWPAEGLRMPAVKVPGDLSSAAFFVVAALLTPGSKVEVTGVGLNPTRTGLLRVLERMGARVEVEDGGTWGPEPVGSVTAETSDLVATEVGADEVPLLVDEVPLLLLAAARAEGITRLRGAADLRKKESDRLAGMAALLRSLGTEATEHPDGMDVVGRPGGWRGGEATTMGDHRLAMVGAIAGAASDEGVRVDNVDCIAVSYPGFIESLERLGGPCVALPDDPGLAEGRR